jgi:DNA-binding SARP family transcriptional activator
MGIFIDRPATTARICMKALEAGIEADYVREMIRERNLMPEQPPWHLENWPWPLKIITLGRFAILKDDKSVRFTKKIQQKPLDLLKALIAFGGREVGEHLLTDALWPDADGDLAHQSFASNLHRLRQLLGFEKAILRQENQLTLDERYCWVDIRAFEHLLGKADAQWKAGEIENSVELIEKAIAFYKGPFLGQEVEQPWNMGISERLRSMFLRSVKKLGNYWIEKGQLEKALECYQRGLEVDRLAEEFYQGLMACYHQLGRHSEAISTYHRCKKALSASLGIEPSSNTEAIYKTIITPPSPS